MSVRAAAPLALMALIFYLSAQSNPGPDVGTLAQVAAHFTEYALLAALWIWALAPTLGRGATAAAIAISLLYALSDEWHQSYVPGRDADPLDLAVDAAGIGVAAAFVHARRRTARAADEPA